MNDQEFEFGVSGLLLSSLHVRPVYYQFTLNKKQFRAWLKNHLLKRIGQMASKPTVDFTAKQPLGRINERTCNVYLPAGTELPPGFAVPIKTRRKPKPPKLTGPEFQPEVYTFHDQR